MNHFDPKNLVLERLNAGAATHAGLVRSHNEDCWHIDREAGLMLLADGMGGYNAGEVASRVAIDTAVLALKASFGADTPGPLAFQSAATLANRAILSTAKLRPECLGMGTTLVMAHLHHRTLCFGHLGDSRLYVVSGKQLKRLTRDHSVGQEMVDSGELTDDQVRRYSGRCILTRALGVEDLVQTDSGVYECQSGDYVLLVSDGLTDMVSDAQLETFIGGFSLADPQALTDSLVSLALAQGGSDNVTVLVALVE
jgi:PPM family protein phosphatase